MTPYESTNGSKEKNLQRNSLFVFLYRLKDRGKIALKRRRGREKEKKTGVM